MPMKLYSGPLSLYSRKVEIALAEKGLAFEREMVPFSQAQGYQPKHPAVLAANPKGQVPVLIDGDLTLFDSTLIFEYLEEAYPKPPLFPADARARARCRLLELAADDILMAPVRLLMYRSEPPSPDVERQRAREADGRRGEAALLEHYSRLEEQVADKEYLCGDFSVADIATFMVVLFALRLKGPRLTGHPALAAWHARVGTRPAVAPVAAELAAMDRQLSPALYS
jgi:glutathione S-transferase